MTKSAPAQEWDLEPIGLRKLSAGDRLRFWERYQATRPEIKYQWGNTFSRWRSAPGTELTISLYVTNHSAGLFVRGARGVPISATRVALAARWPWLERVLSARIDDEAPLLRALRQPMADITTWRRAHEWLGEAEDEYFNALIAPADRPRRAAARRTVARDRG